MLSLRFFPRPTVLANSVIVLLCLFTISQQADDVLPPKSSCLQRCLDPIARLDKSISFMYRHYEGVCEKLEWAANCAQSCGAMDRGSFFQLTTFYRIHCVDFEEELEDLLPCLQKAAYKGDVVCRERCVAKEPAEKLTAKAERQNTMCKNVECSTLCYVNELSEECPNAKQTIIRLNLRIVAEMRRLTRDSDYEKLSSQCQRVHDEEYMRKRIEGVLNKTT